MDDTRALRAVKKGDSNALGWLIDRYSPYVTAIISRVLTGWSASDVEELAADTFVALWNHADKIKPDCVRAWLGAVARNKAKNLLRQQRLESPLEEDILPLELDPLQSGAERRELHSAVKMAVLQLGWPDREIFLRHYYYFQPVSEIAAVMDMNDSTVKSRLRRGREKLKSTLIQGGFADEYSGE